MKLNLKTIIHNSKFSIQGRGGFTLIEIIVVITIVVILAGLGLWVGMDAYRGYSYRSERDVLVSVLQKARLASMVNINEAKHGVHVESNRYTVFQGETYLTRDANFDQIITPGGAVWLDSPFPLPQDVIFDQLSGVSSPITLTITDSIKSSDIQINNEGQISW
ncbi:MAG: Uncharacterized protein G01um101420_448 [Parcubacteria group bacterium Gr01-1014_20]|nr:MAG: Uncharacterized protein G01um101420_448 [Parcubacteria group bacterium Gr01-1014_20]